MLSKLSFRLWMLPLLAVYAILFGEMFIRVLKPTVITPRYIVEADYGVRMNWPNMAYTHTSPEYHISFKINSQGVRSDREIPYQKPKGTYRIVALGDSFTTGYGAEVDETFLAVLEKELQASTDACTVEVINLGVSGFGTAESLLALQNEGVKYQPDAILQQWHSTDLAENVASDLYRLSADGTLTRGADSYLPSVKLRKMLFDIPLYRFVAGNSMLYSVIRERAALMIKRSFLFNQEAPETAEIAEEIPEEVAAPATIETPELQVPAEPYDRRLALALLDKVDAVARDMGAELIIFDVPDRHDRGDYRSVKPLGSVVDDRVYSPIDDFGRYSGQLLYWEESAGHFTPLGNQIVGEGLAARIQPRCD